MFSFVILVLAGLLAGSINALAGGGTLISFPALMWVGVPPVMSNATATLTALDPLRNRLGWADRRWPAANHTGRRICRNRAVAIAKRNSAVCPGARAGSRRTESEHRTSRVGPIGHSDRFGCGL